MTQAVRPRPLSPHLTIYRLPLTGAVMSITHRITGVALFAGTLLFAAWLWSAAYEPAWYDCITGFMKGWFGKTLLFGWSLALYYHLFNGLRHLYWDTGRGFTNPSVDKTGILVLALTVLFTVGTWVYVAFNTPPEGGAYVASEQ